MGSWLTNSHILHFKKEKVYEVVLDKLLADTDRHRIESGVTLEDGLSKLKLEGKEKEWTVRMSEGRNRQIRRTFSALGYTVTKLHRTQFGKYVLPSNLKANVHILVSE